MEATGMPGIGENYVLGGGIGTGQDCQVWNLTDQRQPGRALALKRMHPHSLERPGLCQGVHAEWSLLVGLDLPNLVHVHEVGFSEGLPYAILDRIDGQPLAQILRDRKRVGPQELIAWLRPLAVVLDALHQKGLVHREVAPRNLHLDPRGHVTLSEFGIAKVYVEIPPSTRMAPRFGVFEHLAPETCKGLKPGPSQDQYSLGILAYQALSGSFPHNETGSAFQLVLKRIQNPVEPLSQWVPEVPPGVAAAVMRALQMNPGDRFESCVAFVDAFERGLTETALPDQLSGVPAGGPTPPMEPAISTTSRTETAREKSRRALKGLALVGTSVAVCAFVLSQAEGASLPALAFLGPTVLAMICGWSSRSSFLAFLTAILPGLLVLGWATWNAQSGGWMKLFEGLAILAGFAFSAFLGVFTSALSRRLHRGY